MHLTACLSCFIAVLYVRVEAAGVDYTQYVNVL